MAGQARQRAIAIAITVVVVATVGMALIAPAATAQTSTGLQVQAGVNDPKDPNIAVLEFMPKTITVPTGATVTWNWTGTIEPHSVTFTAPGQELPPPGSDPALFEPTPPTGPYDGTAFVNSGLQPLGPTPPPAFSMTFDKTGSFPYYCVIHPNMIGTVKVVKSGGKIDSAASATRRAKVEQAKWIAEGRVAKRKLVRNVPKPVKNADGSSTYPVEMGVSTAHTDILGFSPAPTAMKAGDSIQFVNNSQAPHTGTFSGATPPIQDPTDPQTDIAIPGPSPQTLNATALFSSGLLPPDVPDSPGGSPPPAAVRSFTFVVPAAGNYPYYCILHATSGMSAAISVT